MATFFVLPSLSLFTRILFALHHIECFMYVCAIELYTSHVGDLDACTYRICICTLRRWIMKIHVSMKINTLQRDYPYIFLFFFHSSARAIFSFPSSFLSRFLFQSTLYSLYKSSSRNNYLNSDVSYTFVSLVIQGSFKVYFYQE